MPAFCQAIAQGCCQGVKSVRFFYREKTRTDCVSALIGALEIDGALPVLAVMSVLCYLGPGGIPRLARALANGTAPQLQDFHIENCENNDLEALADMMEARARFPSCKGLKVFDAGPYWFEDALPGTRIRLLRALLPSVKYLPSHLIRADFSRG